MSGAGRWANGAGRGTAARRSARPDRSGHPRLQGRYSARAAPGWVALRISIIDCRNRRPRGTLRQDGSPALASLRACAGLAAATYDPGSWSDDGRRRPPAGGPWCSPGLPRARTLDHQHDVPSSSCDRAPSRAIHDAACTGVRGARERRASTTRLSYLVLGPWRARQHDQARRWRATGPRPGRSPSGSSPHRKRGFPPCDHPGRQAASTATRSEA